MINSEAEINAAAKARFDALPPATKAEFIETRAELMKVKKLGEVSASQVLFVLIDFLAEQATGEERRGYLGRRID